jgi:hypothetical protein
MSRSLARKDSLFGGRASTVLVASVCWVGCSGSSSEPEERARPSAGSEDAGPSLPNVPAVEMQEPGVAVPEGGLPSDGPAGTGGAEGAMPGAAGTGATASVGGSPPETMAGEPCAPNLPRRLVRLTFPQIINSLEVLLGPEVATALRAEQAIEPSHGTYNQLSTEGHVIGEAVFSRSDAIADAAGRYVEANFEAVTGCLDELDCSRNFVESFAERLFRRPTSTEELDNVLSVFDEAIELGGSPALATRFGVYSALSSPLFLYRSEFGEGDATSGVVQLSAHELASAISFFLTDAPPDDPLASAAASGALSSEALAEQVVRLLDDEPTRKHLERTMFGYLEYPKVERIVVDPAVFPEWDVTFQASARTEAARFLERELWSSPLEALLTSRRTFADERLAGVYGIPFPPSDAMLDTEGFASVELPEGRAGVLTQTAFLMARSRPDGHSVVARGLQVNALFACIPISPAPDDPETASEVLAQISSAQTEREKSDLRSTEPACSTCHALIDPFGLALEGFDSLGRNRTEDTLGRPVDSVVTLPEPAGAATVVNPRELGAALVQSGRFAYCVARGFAEHALSDAAAASCVAEEVAQTPSFTTTPTYSELLALIARSPAFAARTAEGP